MFWVSYFRANRWHTRLFWVKRNAIRYAESFPLTALIRFNIPGY